MQVVLPGEGDARRAPAAPRRTRSSRRRRQATWPSTRPASSVSGSASARPGGPQRGRSRALGLAQHVRAAVRDGLVGADRAVELLAVARVLDRHLHHPLGHPDQLGGHRHRDPVGGGRRTSPRSGSPSPPGTHARVAAGVRRSCPAARCRRPTLRARTAWSQSISTITSAESASGTSVGDAIVQHAHGAACLAGGDARQLARLLLVGAGVLEHQARRRRWTGTAPAPACSQAPPSGSPAPRCRVPGRRAPRRRRYPASRARPARSSARRRSARPRPARAPCLGLKRCPSRSRAVRLIACWSSVKSKFIAQAPIAARAGFRGTRSAMMFLRISVVPPSIELARARRKR